MSKSTIPLLREVSMNIEHNKAVHISAVLNKLKFTVTRGTLSIKDIAPISHIRLIDYLQSHYIPLPLAKKYLAELYIYNKKSKNYFYALGFKSDEGGYEICNKIVKGYIDERAVTSIPGRNPDSGAINVFKDCADFLSLAALAKGGRPHNNSLILNSPHLWRQSQLNIYNPRYKVAYTWLNNGSDSKLILDRLDQYFQSQNILHVPKNEVYAPHNSLTAWRVHKLSQGQ
ncbi:MAG: hypothetical protein ABUT20_46435 [Bacteroidota bacterium]